MSRKTGFKLVFIALYLVLLSGCVTLNDPEASQEYRSDPITEIFTGEVFGQTFVSRRPKFNRVQVWLQISPQTLNDQVVASLYHKPTDLKPLARVAITQEDLQKNFPLSIYFPTQENIQGVTYFLQLEITGGKFTVYGRNENQYSPGKAWINNQPQASDAAFRLGYEYNLIDFVIDLFRQPQIVLMALCIFWLSWLPGRLGLLLAGLDRQFNWGERTAISLGIGLAFYPIIFIWTGVVHFPWTQTRVWTLLGSMTVLYLYLVVRKNPHAGGQKSQISKPGWKTIALLCIFLASLAVRLVMVRDLSAPAWVDSVHHALLGKLIVLNGGLPDSYFPFVGVQTSNYHAGFHVTLAIFQWLSQLEISQALLILGQVINAFMVFSSYLFTTTLVKNQNAGLVAAFVTGLVTPMPAYFTSWGRYTQLAGLVIFPVAIAFLYPYLETLKWQPSNFRKFIKKPKSVALISFLSILFAGLFLTHYRVFAFQIALIFVISLFAFFSWSKQKAFRNNFIHYLFILLPVALLSLILLFPWLPETIKTLFLPSIAWSQSASTKPFFDFSWNLLTSARGIYSLVIALAGFIWAILNRKIFAWVLFIWLAIMFFLANLNVWRLPGSNFINNTSVIISLFLPISVLCGYIISWLLSGWYHWIPEHIKKLFLIGIVVISILLGWLTSKPLLAIVNPTTSLFRELDRSALIWIDNNIPTGETIFINPFAWGYGLFAGNDGGFWISPLSEKPTLPPPVLYGLDLINMRNINIMCSKVIQSNGDPQILYELMLENEIRYLYIGAKGGLLSPEKLQQSKKFQVLYNNQTTWVFQINE